MATNKPRQKRSRERVQKIMLAAADELARTADPDALTTTSVAKRSGVPVATIYRYFADRSAIIAALIDEETVQIDEAINLRVNEMETITFDTLLETVVRTNFEFLARSRRSIVLWLGTRSSKEVLRRVNHRYAYMGSWLINGALRSGMALPETPAYGGEYIVWISDRTFEYIFREKRSEQQQQDILDIGVRMLSGLVAPFSTELGRTGITQERFQEFYGPFAPPPLHK